jgi:hypothetical protein
MSIVETLDVLEELTSNIVDVNGHSIKKLGFYAADRRFGDSVVPTVSSATHALSHAEF